MRWLYRNKVQKTLAALAAVASIGAFFWTVFDSSERDSKFISNITLNEKNNGYISGRDTIINNNREYKALVMKDVKYTLAQMKKVCSESEKFFDGILKDDFNTIPTMNFFSMRMPVSFLTPFVTVDEYIKIEQEVEIQMHELVLLNSSVLSYNVKRHYNVLDKNYESKREFIKQHFNKASGSPNLLIKIEKINDIENYVIMKNNKLKKTCSYIENLIMESLIKDNNFE